MNKIEGGLETNSNLAKFLIPRDNKYRITGTRFDLYINKLRLPLKFGCSMIF